MNSSFRPGVSLAIAGLKGAYPPQADSAESRAY